ncbi:MmcQ/YjbR family DNA-binding protein [Listeria cornellensis]|uniref:MmcQ family protein n=1 Tax=Listeria cornellensis FSL F6-0969 TaxID=1265820 RepID=W7CIA1_9LIST|nr:MmcQ/YjbR family DNA-binding protein [Listeria cornellensis]EUJ32683.1 hypothetical protein PCORN_01900 [Listeria cornellensis FSL F6-0969]
MSYREEIFNFSKNKYNTSPEYTFKKYPKYAVLRHMDNKKWYGLIMNVPSSKLGLSSENEIDIIDIKLPKNEIEVLRFKKGFFPAYHMNKENWISISLEGQVPLSEILELIEYSFSLTQKA